MAISTTYSKQQEELARKQGGIGSSTPYNGMKGVSQSTQNNLGNYQQGYQQSQAAQQYQQSLQSIQQNKPQTYSSKYGAQLDNLLNQITNPSQFKYEFNGDNLFKNYADLYTQKGKQASMDAMGQAAALTGGYGNTYAQQVGNQQYQQYLLNLYDRGMDLYDRAYQRNRDQIGDNLNAYNAVNAADQTQYGRYRDTVGDWQNERDYLANRADTERNFDYNQYQNDLNYWTELAQIENQAYNTEADRQEAIRQYDKDFAEKQRQYNESLAEQQRSTNLDEAYRRDTLGWQQATDERDYAEKVRQYNQDFAEQARQYDTSLAEQQRQANMDEAYRRDTLGWQQSTDARDYAEQVRQYNENLAEQQRQANLDEDYRRDTLAEQIRQADLDETYRNNEQAWKQSTDARDYAESVRQFDETNAYNYQKLMQNQAQFDANLTEEQRQYNQKVAISYVTDILKNGQMPTNELLVAAGLSYEDAQKLMAVISAGGGSGNGGDEEGNGENIWRPAVEASASAGATKALQNDSAAYQAALAAMNLGTTAGTATSAATSAATKKGSTTQKKTGTNAAANALAALGYSTEANILKISQTAKKLTNDQSDANKKNKGFSKSSGN